MTIDECARTLTEYMIRNEPVPPDTLSYTIGTLQALVASERELATKAERERCNAVCRDLASGYEFDAKTEPAPSMKKAGYRNRYAACLECADELFHTSPGGG